MGLLYKRETSTFQDNTLKSYYASSGTTDKPVMVRNIDTLPIDLTRMREFSEYLSVNILSGSYADMTMLVTGNNKIHYFTVENYQAAAVQIGYYQLFLNNNIIETSYLYIDDMTKIYFTVPPGKTELNGSVYTLRCWNTAVAGDRVYAFHLHRVVEVI